MIETARLGGFAFSGLGAVANGGDGYSYHWSPSDSKRAISAARHLVHLAENLTGFGRLPVLSHRHIVARPTPNLSANSLSVKYCFCVAFFIVSKPCSVLMMSRLTTECLTCLVRETFD